MIECQHCGTVAPDGRTFCPSCRRRMAPSVVQVPAPPRGLEPPAEQPPPPPPTPVASPSAPATPVFSPPAPVTGPASRGALAGWVVAALAVAGLTSIWAVVAELHRASVVTGAIQRGGLTVQEADAADNRVALAAGVELLTLLVAAVLFIIWIYRLCRRLHAARPDAFRYGIGWAIGGWFTPIWSLFRPKQMVDDAWRVADRVKGVLPTVPGWVHLWWAAWLISNIMTLGGGRQYGDGSLEGVATADRVSAVGDGISVVAAALAMALVWALSGRAAEVPVAVVGPHVPAYRLNPPPGWPEPPPGWVPPPNWRPDPSWPPPPAGWQLWVPR